MSWNKDAEKLLYKAYGIKDIAEFERLLTLFPDNVATADGRYVLLHWAARDGRLDFMNVLFSHGATVDSPNRNGDPEGPIIEAADNGHISIVRFLLDQGATVNFAVDGRFRCFALANAARKGHLDIVKLLIDRGADMNAAWNGNNCLMEAEMYGKKDVADYLRSIGMRDLRETTTPDYLSGHATFLETMSQLHGELSPWSLVDPGNPSVTLRVTQPGGKDNCQTLFTVGLSDRPLVVPGAKRVDTELALRLPADWPLTSEALADPLWNWPVLWLKGLAREALNRGTWPGFWSSTFLNGNPLRPLSPDTSLCAWIALQAMGNSYRVPDYRWISCRDLYPIYLEEAELAEREGWEELVRRFHAYNIPQAIDPHRRNVATPSA